MASRTIGVILNMKDRFTAPAKKATKSVKSIQREMKHTKNQIRRFGTNIKNSFVNVAKNAISMAKKTTKAILGLGTVAGGIAVKTGFGEAMDMEGYRQQLITATKDTKKASTVMIDAVKKANATPFEGGELIDASSKLEMMSISSKKWLNTVVDSAGSLNKSVDQITEAVIDAKSGEFERLKELGIRKDQLIAESAKKYGEQIVFDSKGHMLDEAKLMNVLQGIMDKRFKGGADKLAGTTKGLWSTVTGVTKNALANIVGMQNDGTIKQGSLYDKLKQKISSVAERLQQWQQDGTIERIGNKVQNVVENIGKALNFTKQLVDNVRNGFGLWNGVVVPILGKIDDLLIKVFGEERGNKISKVLHIPINIIKSILDKAKDLYNFCKNNWNMVEPIIWGIVGALTAYKMIMIAQSVYTGIAKGIAMWKASTIAQTIAQHGLNAALRANPIGFVVTLIGLAITAGVALYKNWDTIKEKAGQLWENMKNIFESIKNKVIEVGQALWNGFASKFSTVAEHIQAKVENIKQVLHGVVDFVAGVFTGDWGRAWQGIKDIFAGIFKGFANSFLFPLKLIRKGMNWVISKVNGISFTAPDWVPFVGGETMGFNIPEIPELPTFAKGGIARKPSIFGEAGAEMAIPLKRTKRSRNLLNQADNIINGNAKESYNKIFIFNEIKEKLTIPLKRTNKSRDILHHANNSLNNSKKITKNISHTSNKSEQKNNQKDLNINVNFYGDVYGDKESLVDYIGKAITKRITKQLLNVKPV